MAELKLISVGNSVGVILPKDVLEQLNVQKGDTLHLTRGPDGYRLTPGNSEFEREMALAEEIMTKYRNALRELAK